MALTTTFAPLRVRAGRPELVALVCAASAGTHAALVGPHLRESLALATAFALAAVALAVAALSEVAAGAARPSRATSVPVATLLLALAVGYLLSRTTGIPGLVEHPEPWDPIGVPLALLEAAAAVLAAAPPHPRRDR